MAYISYDPFHQVQTGFHAYDSAKELKDKVLRTHDAWIRWRNSSMDERVSLLLMLADVLLKERKQHALKMVTEMGKPVSQALAEVDKCALLCRYYALNAERFSCPDTRDSGARKSYVRYDPQGIVFGIMPWNYPFWQVFRFLIPALAGGNCAILKHASNVTSCAMAIESAVQKAGFPESVLTVIFPTHSLSNTIISMPEIRGVTLTGSNAAGSAVASMAGRHLKKCVLELGGSDPFIVFPGADIEKSSGEAVMGRFQNCGQSCIAAKRFIVHNSIYDEFKRKFIQKISELKTGDPMDRNVFMGPMVSNEAADEIGKQVEMTIGMGAGLIIGGRHGAQGPAFYEPTVIEDIPDGSPALTEELFGPVASLYRFSRTDEAVSLANASRFGLGSSVWTDNPELAESVAAMLDTGAVAINGFMRSDPSLPFGGVKDSGFGRELSREGFSEFLNIKSVAYY